jgi:type II secretory pathway pseudopilin PulG
MTTCIPKRPRRAFTLVELTAAMALTTFALGMVAMIAAWSLQDRAQHQARHRALEAAANLLESAQTTPYDQLTDAWAKSQSLPDDDWLPEGKIDVTIDLERPHLKRVTVVVSWSAPANRPRLDVRLVGYYAARSDKKTGGNP